MTDKEYRESPGISRSELWLLNPATGGTPEKFLYARQNPQPPTPAMVFGTLAHLALLEPQNFDEQFALKPEVDGRTKAGKLIWESFRAGLGGRTAVSRDDWALACRMAYEVKQVKFASHLLGGEHEKVFRWVDAETGEECKIRVDAIFMLGDTPVIIDYKTTTDASPAAFSRKCVNMGYDFQAGMYCEGVERVLRRKPRFVFIIQERDAPYAVNVLEADEEFILTGRETFRDLLGIYHDCKTTNNWYGYLGAEPVIGRLSLPAWALTVN